MDNSKRVEWMEKAYQTLKSKYLPEAPKTVTISAGFPSSGARSSKLKTLGECAYNFIQKDGEKEHLITVHFKQFVDEISVLHVLLHEMLHASGYKGHGKDFSQRAKSLGLLKPWKSTTPSENLKSQLTALVQEIGEMPKGFGDITDAKKQKSRLRKYACSCGVIVRVSSDDFQSKCLKCNTQFQKVSV